MQTEENIIDMKHIKRDFSLKTWKRKRKLIALLLCHRCIVTINVLWLFLTVPWVGLQYVIMVFPGHTHLLSGSQHQGGLRGRGKVKFNFFRIWSYCISNLRE